MRHPLFYALWVVTVVLIIDDCIESVGNSEELNQPRKSVFWRILYWWIGGGIGWMFWGFLSRL